MLRLLRLVRTLLGTLLAVIGASVPARAQSPENVAVVINVASPISVRIGEYYVRKRAAPSVRVEDEVSRPVFAAAIE